MSCRQNVYQRIMSARMLHAGQWSPVPDASKGMTVFGFQINDVVVYCYALQKSCLRALLCHNLEAESEMMHETGCLMGFTIFTSLHTRGVIHINTLSGPKVNRACATSTISAFPVSILQHPEGKSPFLT